MKKALKILGYGLGVILPLLAIFAAYIHLKGIPDYPVEMPLTVQQLQVPTDTLHSAEGKRIASMLCRECHFATETQKMTGSHRTDIPKEFGEVYSLNLTHDSIHGIGAWTDGELYYFLRTGIRPQTGQYVPPFMPKFPRMSDEDMHSIIAWLRSDDPELAADPHEYPANKANFLVKLLANVAFGPLPLPRQPIMEPDSSHQVALGQYVADGMIGCFNCHSADLKTINELEPEKTPGFYGGGTAMLDMDGQTEIVTANLTMDPTTGIGKLTEQEFMDAVRFCKKPGGGLLHYPMTPHAALSETEVRAIYAYLKTLPVIQHAVVRYKEASN